MQSLDLVIPSGKKVYFASDFHLGTPDEATSLLREKKIVAWLDTIATDAHSIFLLGDQFDFWFEFKYVIPKGFSRFIGKLAELKDKQIPVYLFTGNHDMWMFDYFPKELGIPVIRGNMELVCQNKKILIGHGDGLGPGDTLYKFLKFFFNSRICQHLFAMLHPWIGFSIATKWSRSSRSANVKKDEQFLGEQERLWQYCKDLHITQPYDYYIFGHRHLVLELPVSSTSTYLNLGEWVTGNTFATFDGEVVELEKF